MKKYIKAFRILLILFLFNIIEAFGWGMIGHRTVGEIAQIHLSKKAGKKITEILDGASLAEVSNYMDDIKSDDSFDHTHDWHWVTIPTGEKYENTEKNPNGDIIQAIERLIDELKKGQLSKEKEAENIKFLIHLIGDIHQPLHVNTGDDRGGNDIKLKWFWEDSNLHRVWDSGMIDSKLYSYSELTKIINRASDDQIATWQSSEVTEWAYESMALRAQVYDLPEDDNLNYEYRYKNWETVKLRLLQAGIRLAGVLNEIYK